MSNRADDVRAAYPLFQAEGGGATPTSALSFTLCEIEPAKARELNRLWHSMLPDFPMPSFFASARTVCYGADFDGNWYAVAIWTAPVAANRMKNAEGFLELRRFAIAPDAPKNTASRLLRIMASLVKKKFPSVTRLISYQAVSVHEGTIYKAAGWTPTLKSKFTKWKTRTAGKKKARGRRNAPQTESDKVRWEKELHQ